jgi:excisionase family DNA binding protein
VIAQDIIAAFDALPAPDRANLLAALAARHAAGIVEQPAQKAPEALLTPDDVGQALQLKRDAVYALLRTGRIRSLRPGGRLYRVRPEDLRAYQEDAARGVLVSRARGPRVKGVSQ